MQIFSLASGSGGNCTLVSDGDCSVLIDAGISNRRIEKSLEQLGFSMNRLSGILITHEHGDHVSGLATLVKHYEVPIFAPRTVANHLRLSITGVADYISELRCGEETRVGSLGVVPFLTPHDTDECVGYRISGSSLFGFCTDCGHVSDEVLAGLSGVDAAVIEANHDLLMLQQGSYPIYLKRRILSDRGHLSNDCCGELALELFKGGTKQFLLGHLSRENNSPRLALGAVSSALSRHGIEPDRDVFVNVAPEKEIFSLAVEVSAKC